MRYHLERWLYVHLLISSFGKTPAAISQTLALAAKLSIDSGQARLDVKSTTIVANDIVTQRRAASFWKTIHEELPGSIPAEIIFVPGNKVLLDDWSGFGWAPLCWSNADNPGMCELPMPGPGYTDLIPGVSGLFVTFPGILLRLSAETLHHQFLNTDGQNALYLPLNGKGLEEWYSLTSTELGGDIEFLAELVQLARRRSQPALILANRTIPEFPPSVALLVEINKATTAIQHLENPSMSPGMTYKCQIIRRVLIRREATSTTCDGIKIRHLPTAAFVPLTRVLGYDRVPALELSSQSGASNVPAEQVCSGEWTPFEQRWTVDDYRPDRSIISPVITTTSSAAGQDQESLTTPNSGSMQEEFAGGRENETLETSIQSQFLMSPLREF